MTGQSTCLIFYHGLSFDFSATCIVGRPSPALCFSLALLWTRSAQAKINRRDRQTKDTTEDEVRKVRDMVKDLKSEFDRAGTKTTQVSWRTTGAKSILLTSQAPFPSQSMLIRTMDAIGSTPLRRHMALSGHTRGFMESAGEEGTEVGDGKTKRYSCSGSSTTCRQNAGCTSGSLQ